MKTTSLRRTLVRGAVHATVGLMIGIAIVVLPRALVLIALALFTITFLLFEVARRDIPSLRRYFFLLLAPLLRKEEENQLTGGSYLLVGSLVSALIFPPGIASLAITFLALGDPVAAVVGTWLGKTGVWRKNIQGNLACLAACLLGGVVVNVSLSVQSPGVLILGAVAATLVQALPVPLNDNLTMPIGSGIVMVIAASLS